MYLDDEQHHALGIKFDLDLLAGEGRRDSVYAGTPVALLIEREESDNPARAWWDSVYGSGG